MHNAILCNIGVCKVIPAAIIMNNCIPAGLRTLFQCPATSSCTFLATTELHAPKRPGKRG